MRSLIWCALIIFTFLNISCRRDYAEDPSQTPVSLQDTVLTGHLQFPWEIVWGADNMIWMTERGGTISRVDPATGKKAVLHTIAGVRVEADGGLLGMALHPDFAAHPQVFVAYNYDDDREYRLKIVRFTYSGNSLTDPVTLIDDIPASLTGRNGCRLLISPDMKLFVSTGDISNTSLPQDAASLNGKILRLNLDGSIPGDNPVAGSAIYSLGFRNTQGLAFANGMLYGSEHGADTDDEINIIQKGGNYGWPLVSGVCNNADEQLFCESNNVVEPFITWTPNLAISGIEYYHHDEIPQWRNSLLVTALKGSRLIQLRLNAAHDATEQVNELLVDRYGRLRDVCISPEGRVFVCTSNGDNDKIIEIKRG